jgi:hypothetical protein
MTTVAIPLRSIAQQIEQHESELERLRRAYQTRQTQLAELKRRKEELEAQLHQVDTEIEAVEGEAAAEAPGSSQAVPVEAKSEGSPTLPVFLVTVLKEVGQPMTIKQLADEVERRKFPTTSQNVRRLVQTRVRELVNKEILEHAKGQPGYVLAQASKGEALTRSKTTPAAKKRPPKKSSTAKASPRSQLNGRKDQPAPRKDLTKKTPSRPQAERRKAQPPLRVVLTKLLQESTLPKGTGELAQQALATGYRSDSEDFPKVVSVMLSRMENVVNVPGKGFRLKKGKG